MVFSAAKTISDDPRTMEEALSGVNAKEWKAALIKEYRQIKEKGTFKEVPKSKVPAGQKILSGKPIFKTKQDKNSQILKYKV